MRGLSPLFSFYVCKLIVEGVLKIVHFKFLFELGLFKDLFYHFLMTSDCCIVLGGEAELMLTEGLSSSTDSSISWICCFDFDLFKYGFPL